MKVNNNDFTGILHNTPLIISNIYYDMIKQGKCKVPRKASVLKIYKDNLRHFTGFPYKDLTVKQQEELLYMAEDAYNGIREAEQ